MSNKYPGGIITSGAPAGYSVAFDNTGDYLTVAANSAFDMSTGDFTWEGWAYIPSDNSGSAVISINGAELFFRATANGQTVAFFNGSLIASSATSYNFNQWNHVAVTRSGTTLRVYLNGVSGTSATYSSAVGGAASTLYIGVFSDATSDTMFGYLSNVRIVKGTAVYTGASFTPPTQLLAITNTSLLTCNSPAIVDQSSNNFTITANGNAAVSTFTPFQGYVAYNPALGAATPGVWTITDALQAAQTRRWNMYDPYFNYTTLLLHGNGTNGAQNNTFLDSSSNNFTITRNGNTTQGSFSPFSQTGWSNYFDGSSRITLPSNAAFAFGTGAYTVEFYVYHIGLGGTQARFFDAGSASGSFGVGINNTNTLSITNYGGANVLDTASNALVVNQWNHVAFVRDSTSTNATRIYVNGTLSVTGTDSNNWTVTTTPTIAGLGIAGYYPISYLSNLRITKGGSLYTSNFTPSTTPLTTTVNAGTVSLLTCQSNRFIDNSANGFALTVAAGTPSVQAFSPFLTNIAYTPTNQGGGGYFDGSGDYLTTNNFNFGTNAFTIEGWFYVTTTAGNMNYWGMTNGGGTNPKCLLYMDNAGNLVFETGSISGAVISVSISTYVRRNAWQHIAISRSGTGAGQTAMFIDGVRAGTGTCASLATVTAGFNIGYIGEGFGVNYNGYIANFRVVNGTAVYNPASTTVTIPTAPLTAVANTALLTNFTNAGIVDPTAKNVLETVGNAQISTTQSKFGGTSMSFPATNGNYVISPPNQQNLLFGTGPFTIELWVYPTAFTNTAAGIVGYGLSGGYVDWNLELNTSGTLLYIDNNAGRVSSSSNLSLNTWTHIAVVRTASAVTVYFNGASVATYSTINNISGSSTSALLYVGTGAQVPASRQFIGYIDDLRITKGYARYTANFTPQTSQWQDQ